MPLCDDRPSVFLVRLEQIVRRTIVFCDQHRTEMVGFEAEQFQELLIHEFNRQCGQGSAGRFTR